LKKIFKKLLPFAANKRPLHAGEIYYLWEGLTSGYKAIEIAETYLMNSEDTEIQVILQSIIKGIYLLRIQKLEKILKEEGFTVPPRPASKTLQGKPGSGQEVQLSDDEVLLNLVNWGQALLQHDGRAVMACTRESVRKVFTDLLFDEIRAYNILVETGKKRHIFNPAPPATANDNSLNMTEVAYLWGELGARYLSFINIETYIASTNDQELLRLLKRGLNQIIIPQMKKLENILKNEGFTIPARPPERIVQGTPGQVNKIKFNEDEIIGILTAASQTYINYHIRGYFSSMRQDIRAFFEEILSTEIEEYQKIMCLAQTRHTLENPPVVTSKRG